MDYINTIKTESVKGVMFLSTELTPSNVAGMVNAGHLSAASVTVEDFDVERGPEYAYVLTAPIGNKTTTIRVRPGSQMAQVVMVCRSFFLVSPLKCSEAAATDALGCPLPVEGCFSPENGWTCVKHEPVLNYGRLPGRAAFFEYIRSRKGIAFSMRNFTPIDAEGLLSAGHIDSVRVSIDGNGTEYEFCKSGCQITARQGSNVTVHIAGDYIHVYSHKSSRLYSDGILTGNLLDDMKTHGWKIDDPRWITE